MTVSAWPSGMDPSSAKIKLGADRLGWKSHEVHRFWKYERQANGELHHHRQIIAMQTTHQLFGSGSRKIESGLPR